MDEQQIALRLLERYRLRTGPHTRRYLLERVSDRKGQEKIAVMGGDALSGLPRRELIDLTALRGGGNEAKP